MPAAADRPLEEHRGVPGRPRRFRARALEGLIELLGGVDQPDTAPAAAGGGLHHQRVADLLGLSPGLLQVGHGAAAPRRERHADLLGQPLGFDLVAEPAHDLGGRADKGDPQPVTQLGELGLLRDEPPARPHRVGPALPQRALQLGIVEIGAGPERGIGVRRADQHRLVGLADEHRVPVGGGVHGDEPQRRAPFGVPLPDRVDQPHGRFAPVDDRDALEDRCRHVAHPLDIEAAPAGAQRRCAPLVLHHLAAGAHDKAFCPSATRMPACNASGGRDEMG